MKNEEGTRLYRLDELDDFEVADNSPDVRGWDVQGTDGHKFGEVAELIVDTTAMKVRYLDIELDLAITDEVEQHVLIPVGLAHLDESDDVVIVGNLNRDTVLTCPVYKHNEYITREQELAVCKVFAPDASPNTETEPTDGTSFYSQPHFDDQQLYRNKRQ